MGAKEKLPDIARTAQGDGAKIYNPEEIITTTRSWCSSTPTRENRSTDEDTKG